MATMAERLIQAWHSHDARWVAALFAEDYLSDQPAHPGRAVTGHEQVLANWTEVFGGVPDFSAKLRASSVAGDTEWTRTGRHPDGSAGWSVTLPRPHPVNARAVTNPTTMGGKASSGSTTGQLSTADATPSLSRPGSRSTWPNTKGMCSVWTKGQPKSGSTSAFFHRSERPRR
jgi:hypothetical protein